MLTVEELTKGLTAEQIEAVAAAEGVAPEVIRKGLTDGTIVVPCNPAHKGLKPMAIGKGLRTKVSASIGIDAWDGTVADELEKLQTALSAGTNAIMDLSIAGDMDGPAAPFWRPRRYRSGPCRCTRPSPKRLRNAARRSR